MKFEGVLFDLDGTLIDSLDDLADSMNTVLQNNHFPTHETEAYRQFIGGGLRNLVRMVLSNAYKENEELVNRCLASMVEIYNENCMNKTRPYEGIPELLDELASRRMKLSILSNKNDALSKKIVQTLLPQWKFEYIVGLTTEALKKPNPAEALRISRGLDILPENMLYVGDSGIDMQTAKNAGMYAAGALWGFRSKEELLVNGARVVLDHPSGLISLL
jgi:phosphoglycolate phosphatase